MFGVVLQSQKTHPAREKEKIIKSKKTLQRILILTIVFVTVGQLALTLYLPALPIIAISLRVSSGEIQASVTLFLLAFGISQVFYGFLSDKCGRKTCLLVGLCILILATVSLIAFSHSYIVFILSRFLQGLGAGAISVTARAIIRDSFPKEKLAGAFALIIMSVSLTPAVAPFLGGWLEHFFNWQAIFYFLLLYIIIVTVLIAIKLPETLLIKEEHQGSQNVLTTLKKLVGHSYFLLAVSLIILLYSCQIIYISICPFIFENQLHLSSATYGTLIMLPAAGYLIGNILTKKMGEKFRCRNLIASGVCLVFISASLLTLIGLLKLTTIMTTLICLFILTIGIGLAFSNMVALSLQPFTVIAGAAAAVSGFLQMSGTSMVNGIINFLHIDTILGLGFSLLTCSILMGIILIIIYQRYNAVLLHEG